MKSLLAAVDFSDLTDRVIAKAAEMARACEAKLWLLHCVTQQPTVAAMGEVPMVLPVDDSALPDQFPAKYRHFSQLTNALQSQGVNASMLFVSGAVTTEILAAAEGNQVDMIIMGSHGHGALYDLVVGSVAKSVLYYTTTPTLIVPAEARKGQSSAAEMHWEEPMATPY